MAEKEFELDFEPAFQFAPEEDDDWREDKAPVEQLVLTGVGDWIRPVDSYHARGADFGQIQQIRGQNAQILWAADRCSTNMFIGDIYPIVAPTPIEINQAQANSSRPSPPACPDRVDPNPTAKFGVGTLVMTRAINCRHGVQLGIIAEVLGKNRYRVDWQHIIGIRPKDSRTSFQPKSWRRCQLLSAELTWQQLGKGKKAVGAHSMTTTKRKR
jgi:hypothetical protein